MPAEPETPGKSGDPDDKGQGFWKRFSKTLESGRQAYVADLKEVFGRPALDDAFWDDLEASLIAADVGVATTEGVVANLRRQAAGAHLRTPAQALRYLKTELGREMVARPRALNLEGSPAVLLVVGVNGSGKTTTIGKLAHLLRAEGRRPLLAAADTYRAAAIDQLRLWANRAQVDVIANQPGSDPGAVAFDAVQAARARGADTVIVDTAGRLHTRTDLMEELRKVRRVLQRLDERSPQETLAVLDAHLGQNSAQQVKVFQEAIGLTGLAVTKMDGSAKAGVVLSIEAELAVPVKLVGIGEGVDDLNRFDPEQYLDALLRMEESR
ncbi:MAG: signal recognition particle-docking protein FtsY [Chloroflexi bacterium]|nr:MAG: signal recognition particle-docking protein FtsY [Chloroflexota bacterium]TMD66214.1 MAG: signal recognition particle-docking protein FtsY [Chloroflexota bacterium]